MKKELDLDVGGDSDLKKENKVGFFSFPIYTYRLYTAGIFANMRFQNMVSYSPVTYFI